MRIDAIGRPPSVGPGRRNGDVLPIAATCQLTGSVAIRGGRKMGTLAMDVTALMARGNFTNWGAGVESSGRKM